jgi:hypothetical protein
MGVEMQRSLAFKKKKKKKKKKVPRKPPKTQILNKDPFFMKTGGSIFEV